MDEREIIRLLDDAEATAALCARADAARRRVHGDAVHLRAIVEFSNRCVGRCAYCGLRCDNDLVSRYDLPWETVIERAGRAAADGFRTIVLQSGEHPGLDVEGLGQTIAAIKERFDVAVTLSVGEWPREVYRAWREAGADRYLLKLEAADRELYGTLHPGMSWENRRRCIDDLLALGYETGSGNIVGLPGQTAEHLAADILDWAQTPYDMISVSPLIPAAGTPLGDLDPPPIDRVLRVLALGRLVAPGAHMPSTTAMCVYGRQARARAMRSGANVIMIDYTPREAAAAYEIYERAACGSTESCRECTAATLDELGLSVGRGRGGGIRRR